jgi:hypothetical protein
MTPSPSPPCSDSLRSRDADKEDPSDAGAPVGAVLGRARSLSLVLNRARLMFAVTTAFSLVFGVSAWSGCGATSGAALGDAGGSDTSQTLAQACPPGQQRACACSESGLVGAQTCYDNGQGFGSCRGCSDSSASSSDGAGNGGSEASSGFDGGGAGDAALDQSSACTHLNIGIFGAAGVNASSNFQAWLTSAGSSVQRIQDTAPTPAVTAATLLPFDVIVLDWLTRDYTSSEANVVASWVSAGGGIVSMSGYDGVTTDDWHANSLLASLGVAYAGWLLNRVNGAVTDFAIHPITAGLTSVTFAGGYAITDLGGTASTRLPIAFLPDPADAGVLPVGYAIQMGSGRAFVWGDEWIEFDSEWSTLPEIKQLWIQVFAWISSMQRCHLQPLH